MKLKSALKNITTLVIAVNILFLCPSVESIRGSCPSVCVCKWKYGKQAVECTNRALITIPEQIDSETQVLDVTGNNLQILPGEIFQRSELTNLQKIFLRNCQLGQIDNSAFKGLTNLIELDLSYNLLTMVPSATFKDIPFLRDLNLAFNSIQKLDSNAFIAVPGLIKLDLSHCDLHVISPHAYDGLELLEGLKINGNQLSELRPRTVEFLRGLRSVELHENPWVCDCRLRVAKIWLSSGNVPYTTPPICTGGPERVKHRKLSELSVEDFACKPEILPVSRYIEAAVNENATILCRAGSIPLPIIKWYWNGKLLLNNTFFNAQQRIYIYEEVRESVFEKRSSLVLTNAIETESSEFYCVAENRAGSSEANFTLHVSLRMAGVAALNGSKIIGLSGILICLTLSLVMTLLVLFVRFRRSSDSESKTPNNHQPDSAPRAVIVKAVSGNDPGEHPTHSELHNTSTFNPIQKPPRSNETSNDDLANSLQQIPSGNPDLINDTKDVEESEITVSQNIFDPDDRPHSGDYRNICESLYPSGLWEPSDDDKRLSTQNNQMSTFQYNDKTAILNETQLQNYAAEHCHVNPNGISDLSTNQSELTDLCTDHCHVNPTNQFPCGYPADYGLPIVPGAGDSQGPVPMIPPETVMPMNAKTLRVWQKGGVPVLPPVSAIKRALTHRGDDVYQDGYGTNV